MNRICGPETRGGSGRDLPAGPFSTPHFLAARRSPCRAAGKKLLSLRLPRNITKGSADPFGIPWVPGMQCLTNEIIFCGFRKHSLSGLQLQSGMQYVQRPDCRAANLQSFAAARHFCSAKILAGGLRWGWGPRRSRQRHRPRKEISRGNLLCAKSGLPSLSYSRRWSAQKYVTTPDWENLCTGQPRGV